MSNFVVSNADFQSFGLLKGKKVESAATKQIEVQDTAVQQAAAEAARRKSTARGYRSTVLGDLATSSGNTVGSLKTTIGS